MAAAPSSASRMSSLQSLVMQRSCSRATAVELSMVAQLLPPPSPIGDVGAPWPSSELVAELLDGIHVEHCPVKAPACGGRRRRRGSMSAARDDDDENPRRGKKRTRRKKEETTTTLVTTVPDFDGYQWKKYGQKQIEGAKYPRRYYRCTNSTEQGCPAKRTVQRLDGDGDGDGGGAAPKYTVVYIAEHTCRTVEPAAAPVILDTTVRTNDVRPAADSAAVGSSSTAAAAGAESPATSSDITWISRSSDCANSGEYGYYPPHVVDAGLFADWYTASSPPEDEGAAFLREVDFAGPIRSPVHAAAAADGWIHELLRNEQINIGQMFGIL